MKSASKKGFTLVELAIVLVIIGLLIGGILVAQSMIQTTKSQALARQIGQFDAGISNFKSKYLQLPGDNSLFGDVVGNNDGDITDSAPGLTLFDGEIGKFWSDLAKTGVRNLSGAAYTDASNGGVDAAIGVSVPRAEAGTNVAVIGYGNAGENFLRFGGLDTSNPPNDLTPYAFENRFVPADVLALDTKLDDGVANAGVITAVDGTTLNLSVTTVGAANGCTLGNGDDQYDLNDDPPINECQIRVRMGSSTGTLY